MAVRVVSAAVIASTSPSTAKAVVPATTALPNGGAAATVTVTAGAVTISTPSVPTSAAAETIPSTMSRDAPRPDGRHDRAETGDHHRRHGCGRGGRSADPGPSDEAGREIADREHRDGGSEQARGQEHGGDDGTASGPEQPGGEGRRSDPIGLRRGRQPDGSGQGDGGTEDHRARGRATRPGGGEPEADEQQHRGGERTAPEQQHREQRRTAERRPPFRGVSTAGHDRHGAGDR